MKINKLLALADEENLVLAEHAARWFERRKLFKSAEQVEKDPVSTALDWRREYRNGFFWSFLVLAIGFIFAGILELWSGNPLGGKISLLIAVLSCVFFLVLLFVVAFMRLLSLPTETKLFLEAITLLEQSPGRHDEKHHVYSEEILGDFPVRREWSNESDLFINARRILEAIAEKIVALQGKKTPLWKVKDVEEKAEALRRELGYKHFRLRRLINISEDHGFFYERARARASV